MSSDTGSTSPGHTGKGGFVPPSTADLDAIFASYEFIDLLGRGGMGAVYKARQKSLDRLVAIKILPPSLVLDGEESSFHFAERFQREARAMAKLSHPNIIAVYDFGQASDGQFYFVMEYIEGTDLHALIQGGQLTPEHVAGWISQICDALQYAHAKGIVHRDIKPANIMITLEGQVKVADFGLAKLTGAGEVESKLTMTNMAMGTPDYVAPEALEAGVEVDHRADLYAVGVMLYEMLTGKVPRGSWKSPSTQIPGLDPRYDKLIERAMDADREERHQQASEISATIYEISTTPAKPAPGRRTLLVGDAAGTGPVLPSVSSSKPGTKKSPAEGRSSRLTPTHSAPKAKAPVKLIAGLAICAVGVGLGLFFVFKSESDAPPETVVIRPETVIPATPAPQATTPSASAPDPVVTQADPGRMPIPPKEKPAPSVPVSVSVAASSPETKSPFSDWTLRHSEPSGTDWRPTGNEISSSKKTTLWSPDEHGDFELELEWKVGAQGNGGVFYHVASWNELEALEFQLADPANDGSTPTGGIYGIDLPVTDRSKPVGEWNTARLLVRGSQREHWINGEKVLSYDVDSPGFRDRVGRTNLKTPLNTAARSGRLVLQANAGEIAYRNLRLTPLDSPPAVTAPAAPSMPADPRLGAAPTDPVSQKLAELERTFLAAYETQVTPKHAAAVATLNTNYISKLDRDIAAASQAGKLDEALSLREEKTQIETHGTVPAEDSADLPAVLAPLRSTYRTTLSTLLANRDQLAAPLHAAYDRALATYQDELTRAQKLDEATRVKAVRDHTASRRESKPDPAAETAPSTNLPPVGQKATVDLPPVPVAPPLPASKILPPPTEASQEDIRALADWMFQGGASNSISIAEGPVSRLVKESAALPRGNIKVVGIYFHDLPITPETPRHLATLGGLADLERLNINRHVGVFPIESLRGLTKLKSLIIGQSKFDDSGFAHLSGMTALTEARFSQITGFTGTGLGYLGDGIENLSLWGNSHLTAEGLAYLSRFRKLNRLELYQCPNLRDEMLRPLAALTELESLEVHGTPLDGSFLASLPDNSKLTHLDLGGLPNAKLEFLTHLARLKNLETIVIPPIDPPSEIMRTLADFGKLKKLSIFHPFTGDTLAGITGFRGLTDLDLKDSPISDAGWAAIVEAMPALESISLFRPAESTAPNTAAAMGEQIEKLKNLRFLSLSGPTFTDDWLLAASRAKNLDAMHVYCPLVTDAGLVHLQDLPLTALRISTTSITDASIPTLKKFPKLIGGYIYFPEKMSPAGIAEVKAHCDSRDK